MLNRLLFISSCLWAIGCSKQPDNTGTAPTQPQASYYFPPVTGSDWQATSTSSLGWNTTALNDLYTYLDTKGTKAFIILKDGKMVVEKYFGNFTATSDWYWASAGKTMTAFLVGIARKEGKLSLQDPSSKYLKQGWTSLQPAQEAQITIQHQLTMTTGLDDGVADADCTTPNCLQYKAAPGSRWAYHNAPYTLLDQVVEAATGLTYNQYFDQRIKSRIGMNGIWLRVGYNNVYYSNARSMARFGLLLLAGGKWNGTPILDDPAYYNAQVNSSQTLNPSYGYLTWLNGKGAYMLPGVQFVFQTNLIPNAPTDLYAALGKNDQKIYVVPSKGLVVIRMGETANQTALALSSFDNELWGKLKTVGLF
jgi:CubicO group peptidase (beta-lactamase class C family)